MVHAGQFAGQVIVEDEGPLARVCVSNGLDVTQTDGSGRYHLPARAGCPFVWVTVPGGYQVDCFYLDVRHSDPGRGDFRLRRRPTEAPQRFTLAQITDIHLSTERRCLPEDLAHDLTQLLETTPVDFIVASGDLTAGGTAAEFDAYRTVVADLGVPVFHAAGNHDDDAESGAQNFQDCLGPLYYSFDWGPVHFVVYDGEDYARRGSPIREHAEAFPYHATPQDDWLRRDLAAQPPSTPVIMINHFPWGSAFHQQWEGCGIVAVLAGHWHSSRRFDAGGVVHFATPSLCFGGIDQSQRGYRLFRWEGGLTSETAGLSPTSGVRPSAPRLAATNRAADPGAVHWPQFQAGPLRQGTRPLGPEPPLARRWSAKTGGTIHTASCVAAAGLVFQATMDDDDGVACGVTALDVATGETRWRCQSRASIRHSAASWQDRVYAATVTGEILCINACTGEPLWQHQLSDPSRRWMFSSPLVSHGRVYTGVSADLVALDGLTGQVLWHRQDLGVEDWISSYPSPALAAGLVVVPFYTQPTTLAVLEASTGRTVWQLQGHKQNYIYATPVVADEVVYAVSGNAVRAFDLNTGHCLWQAEINLGRIQATPALSGTRLIVATGTGVVHALDIADGGPLWQWQVQTGMPLFTPYARNGPTTLASPVVAAGVVWIAAADGCLYALNETSGQQLWHADIGAPLGAAPAVGQHALFLGATDGTMKSLVSAASGSTGDT